MQDLLRFKFDQNYIDFDFETEGLNLVKARPYQIAWLTATGKKIKDKQNRFIYWKDLNVSDGAAKVTGFDKAYFEKSGRRLKRYKIKGKIVNAEPPEKIFKEFDKIIYNDKYKVLGQNILGYDVYVHNNTRLLLGQDSDYSYIPRVLDTKALSAGLLKETPVDNKNFIFWQYRLLNFKKRGFRTSQQTMLSKLNIDFDKDQLHDALYDIEMNFKLFWGLINSMDI